MGLRTSQPKPFRTIRDFFYRLLGRRPRKQPFYKRLVHR